ncbi:MAG TPA: site-specific integrase [Sedimentisphaerales bacterium]|nr:site-specific integrase [Sedimentisphaerales bacterium]
MRAFRTYYKDKDGKKRQAKRWYVDFVDHLSIRHRWPAFEDKRASEALGRQIERLVTCKMSGEQPDRDSTRWLDGVPAKLREQLVGIGLLDPERAAAGKPLKAHVEDFRQSLSAGDNTAKHVQQTINCVMRIIDGCHFKAFSDIAGDHVERFLGSLRKNEENFGAQTFNSHIQALKQFCSWMVVNRRASSSPIAHLKRLNVKLDPRHPRRALEVDEIRRLLEVTAAGPTRFGMDGYERCLLYRLAAETGLRANEIRSLTVRSFDLKGLTVTVQAGYSKRRRQDSLPLSPELAELLKEFFTSRLPSVKAFGGRLLQLTGRTGELLEADLADAGIPYVDEAGRYADFHSLRHTTGSLLAASGVHPKEAQELMRHSDVNLTLSLYTHTTRGRLAEAAGKMPDLGAPSSQQQARATGTDGNPVADDGNSAFCLAKQGGKHRTPVDASGQVTRDNDNETAFLNEPGRKETQERPSINPMPTTPQSGQDKRLTQNAEIDSAIYLAILEQDADLRRIVERWSTLSLDKRESIVRIVQ